MTDHLRDAKLWNEHQHVPAANAFVDRMAKAITLAKNCTRVAQQRQEDYAQKRHRPHNFKMGERALLSSKNIKLRSAGTPKLQPKWLGPFMITKLMGTQACELELPKSMRIHDVFHVSLLKPYRSIGRS